MSLPWRAPDYGGRCLDRVLPDALALLTGDPMVLPYPAAERVVLVLVDGLGRDLLAEAGDAAPFLASMSAIVPEGIDAVFPSTTAASITSLGTGLPPGGHGMVGASFWLPEHDNVLFPLRWRERPEPLAVQPEPTVLQQAAATAVAVTVVSERSLAGSGLTSAALRGGRYVGADSPGEIVVALAAAAAEPPPALVYGYFHAVDKSGHIHGAGSEQWLLDLRYTDRAIADLADRLPRGTLLLVTGDHGMVNCPDAARINVDDHALHAPLRRMAGEPRMRHLYVRPGFSAADAAAVWQRHLGDAAVVLTRQQAIDAGLFGPVGTGIAERIGDAIALPTGDGALVSQRYDSIVSSLRGQHGGLTERELKVPLLGWSC